MQGTSLVAQTVKNLPAMQKTWVGSLDCEDPLEEGMATHSSMLAWRIPWAEEPARLWSTESQSWTQLKRLSIKLTPKKDVLFIIGDWNAKVGS